MVSDNEDHLTPGNNLQEVHMWKTVWEEETEVVLGTLDQSTPDNTQLEVEVKAAELVLDI